MPILSYCISTSGYSTSSSLHLMQRTSFPHLFLITRYLLGKRIRHIKKRKIGCDNRERENKSKFSLTQNKRKMIHFIGEVNFDNGVTSFHTRCLRYHFSSTCKTAERKNGIVKISFAYTHGEKKEKYGGYLSNINTYSISSSVS